VTLLWTLSANRSTGSGRDDENAAAFSLWWRAPNVLAMIRKSAAPSDPGRAVNTKHRAAKLEQGSVRSTLAAARLVLMHPPMPYPVASVDVGVLVTGNQQRAERSGRAMVGRSRLAVALNPLLPSPFPSCRTPIDATQETSDDSYPLQMQGTVGFRRVRDPKDRTPIRQSKLHRAVQFTEIPYKLAKMVFSRDPGPGITCALKGGLFWLH
jgi:hypothetical protein